MLGRVVVRETHGIRDVPRLYDDALWDALAHDRETRQSARLAVDLVFDLGDCRVWESHRDKHDLRVDAVFGLREQVCGDERGRAGFVSDDLGVACQRLGEQWMTTAVLTRTSLGPAGISIETSAAVSFCTNILAAVTH